MESPDFVICVECECPCYDFTWKGGELVEVLCATCGNEDPSQFLTQDDYDSLIG